MNRDSKGRFAPIDDPEARAINEIVKAIKELSTWDQRYRVLAYVVTRILGESWRLPLPKSWSNP